MGLRTCGGTDPDPTPTTDAGPTSDAGNDAGTNNGTDAGTDDLENGTDACDNMGSYGGLAVRWIWLKGRVFSRF